MDEATLYKQVKSANPIGVQHDLGKFIADALCADSAEMIRHRFDRRPCRCFNLETQHRRKSHRPQESQMIFGEALFWLADGANDP